MTQADNPLNMARLCQALLGIERRTQNDLGRVGMRPGLSLAVASHHMAQWAGEDRVQLTACIATAQDSRAQPQAIHILFAIQADGQMWTLQGQSSVEQIQHEAEVTVRKVVGTVCVVEMCFEWTDAATALAKATQFGAEADHVALLERCLLEEISQLQGEALEQASVLGQHAGRKQRL